MNFAQQQQINEKEFVTNMNNLLSAFEDISHHNSKQFLQHVKLHYNEANRDSLIICFSYNVANIIKQKNVFLKKLQSYHYTLNYNTKRARYKHEYEYEDFGRCLRQFYKTIITCQINCYVLSKFLYDRICWLFSIPEFEKSSYNYIIKGIDKNLIFEHVLSYIEDFKYKLIKIRENIDSLFKTYCVAKFFRDPIKGSCDCGLNCCGFLGDDDCFNAIFVGLPCTPDFIQWYAVDRNFVKDLYRLKGCLPYCCYFCCKNNNRELKCHICDPPLSYY